MDYQTFLATKTPSIPPAGFVAHVQNPHAYPFQIATVEWALHLGRAAIFADTGLGKTLMQLLWAHEVVRKTGGKVLLLTPLAVGAQTVREAGKFGIPDVRQVKSGDEMTHPGIYVTNYERLHLFEAASVAGVVLDESSILKSYMGSTKRALIDRFAGTAYRLACTATPAPNDHMELGNHSEFLGVMDSHRMLARWFISDQSEAGVYRLKGHAEGPFWQWVTSWARCIGQPSDMGPYSDEGYLLPPLTIHRHSVDVDRTVDRGEELFRTADLSATGLHKEKRRTVEERADRLRELFDAEPHESWVLWADTNYEQDAIMARFPDAIDVRGGMSAEIKAERLLRFTDEGGVIVTKPGIAGMGLNWQHAARQGFIGLSYSYEQLYQAIRRSWRFGQPRPVDVHVIAATTELPIWTVIDRKRDAHERMKVRMFAASRASAARDAHRDPYTPLHTASIPTWLRSTP